MVLESEAVLGIIALCNIGLVELLSSEALLYEGVIKVLCQFEKSIRQPFWQRQKAFSW